VYFLDTSNFDTAQILSCRGIQAPFKAFLLGSNVWMEVVQKLVAVALVSMVTSADGLQNCFGINLGMAAACAMVQAYARPQVRLVPCTASSKPSRLLQKNSWVMSAVSFLSCCAFTCCRFAPPPFSWPAWRWSLFTIILSVYCRPLSGVDNFWFMCLPWGMQVNSSMLLLSQTLKIVR